ncbi:MAG: GFA family protein [Alphaproteobacteria bacterium]
MTGGCLCGAVRYEADTQGGGGHCQCTDCRRVSGTGHSSHMIVPEAAFRMSGTLRYYDKAADSGNIVSRGFCPTCGAPVLSRNAGYAGVVFVRPSSLDDPEAFKPAMVVYTSRGPSWDRIDPALPAFATMPSADEMPDM